MPGTPPGPEQSARSEPLRRAAAAHYERVLAEAVANGGLADTATYQAWRRVVREFHRAVSLRGLEEGDRVRGPDGSEGTICGVDVSYRLRVRWEAPSGSPPTETETAAGSLVLLRAAAEEYRAESWG